MFPGRHPGTQRFEVVRHGLCWGILSRRCLSAAIMSSVLQKLISPLADSPSEPPRNKVTVVGVGQVGMACAVSILLRVRRNAGRNIRTS